MQFFGTIKFYKTAYEMWAVYIYCLQQLLSRRLYLIAYKQQCSSSFVFKDYISILWRNVAEFYILKGNYRLNYATPFYLECIESIMNNFCLFFCSFEQLIPT